MTNPFERTTCACDEDVANCRRQPGYLGVEDASAIARYLGAPSLDPTMFRRGRAVLGSSVAPELILEVATIVPARRASGDCVFLTANDRCGIHAVAPYGCAYFDVHQSRDEADRRSIWMTLRIAVDESYQRLARSLAPKE
jgi:hypothetical protein